MDSTPSRRATPLLLSDRGQPAQRLEAVSRNEPPFRESRLQELLAAHPEVLPVSEIEPAHAPLISLGREISTPSGFVDVLYVSPGGYLTLVEAKMWDNPEARREVVGQIVEYAKDFARWGFEDLDEAVRRADARSDGAEAGGILERVRGHGHSVDASSFVDTVARKLRRGEFLLLVVGNGIRENLQSLSAYLQDTPNLHFSLRLVELTLFRLEPGQDWPLLVQPRVVGRTSEVTRAVVDVHAPGDVEVTVDLPSEEDEEASAGRQTLTEKAFYEQLAENTSASVAEEVRTLVEEMTDLGPEKRWRSSSVSLRLPDPGGRDQDWTVVVLRADGQFKLGWLKRVSRRGGYDPEIWKSYRDGVAALTGATAKGGKTKPAPIQGLLRRRTEFVELAGEFVEKLEAAASAPEE